MVAVDFARRVLGGEARRMRISAHPADAVAGHAIGLRSLVMAAGAADDVVPRRRAMEARTTWGKPARRVRITWICRSRRQPLSCVTVRAETRHMASLAARLVRARVNGMS